jgi:hypothetical protein
MAESNKFPNSLYPDLFYGHEQDNAKIWLNRFELFVQLNDWGPEQPLVAPSIFTQCSGSLIQSNSKGLQKKKKNKTNEQKHARYFR